MLEKRYFSAYSAYRHFWRNLVVDVEWVIVENHLVVAPVSRLVLVVGLWVAQVELRRSVQRCVLQLGAGKGKVTCERDGATLEVPIEAMLVCDATCPVAKGWHTRVDGTVIQGHRKRRNGYSKDRNPRIG